MDEILFRSSQKLENFQIKAGLISSQSKEFITHSKDVILKGLEPVSDNIKSNLRVLWQYILNAGKVLKQEVLLRANLEKLYYNLVKIFWQKWTKRDMCFMCLGFICGSCVGVLIVLSIKKKDRTVRFMQAIQCPNYLGIQSVTVVEDADAPYVCGPDDVLISVKAASIHLIDAEICNGYGKHLRKILRSLQGKPPLPVTLGRDCTGIIADLGANVKRLEVGDEVWTSVPLWTDGTLSQSILVPEFRVGRKPKNTGFEGASSIPYAGSIALATLKKLGLDEETSKNKKYSKHKSKANTLRVLIVGGCTPEGCVLVQILNKWGASITTTCTRRAIPVANALGAQSIVDGEFDDLEFDVIIRTNRDTLNLKQFKAKFTTTLPQENRPDLGGFVSRFFTSICLNISYRLLGGNLNDFDEAHLCYVTLDELKDMVERGDLQSVVDKVLQPQDFEMALNHIQSPDSIGSTVITFR